MSLSTLIEASYVIIGGGIAGISCVESVSILDDHATIVLITASPFVKAVTSITPVTKILAEFRVEEKSCDTIISKYSNLTVVVDIATRVDPESHVVTTAKGNIIKYKKLCICCGASPKLIDYRNEHVFGIRDTDTVEVLQQKLKSGRRVMVVGNGGIATEIVYEMEGVDIVWAVKDKHVSAAFIDVGAAQFFQDGLMEKGDVDTEKAEIRRLKYTEIGERTSFMGAALGPSWHQSINLKKQGACSVSIEYEVEVASISAVHPQVVETGGTSWPVYVTLTNGKTWGCDFVVSATGVIPNSETITLEAGQFDVADDKGIKVDEFMRTNVVDIYAAGDVCTANWTLAHHWFQMRLWTQARQMGCYAGRCMIDAIKGQNTMQDFCFEIFTHITRFFGYKVIFLGLFNAQKLDNYELLLRVTKRHEYVKLVVNEGKVEGAILVGETDLEEMCENLILNQLDISELGEELLNPNIDIDDYFD